MMKTIKRFSVSTALVMLTLAVMVGCEKTDYDAEDNILKNKPVKCFSAAISGIDLPARIEAGNPATFLVNYEMPNPCCEFMGFTLQQQSDTLVVEACILLNNDPCTDVLADGQGEFNTTFSLPGTYYLKYYYWGEMNTFSFEVH